MKKSKEERPQLQSGGLGYVSLPGINSRTSHKTSYTEVKRKIDEESCILNTCIKKAVKRGISKKWIVEIITHLEGRSMLNSIEKPPLGSLGALIWLRFMREI